jgi:hypothetical protein
MTDPMTDTAPEEEEETAVCIHTEPSVGGSTYMVTVEIDHDRAIALTPESAPRYAMTVLQAVARAEYDAAVYRQMSALVKDDRVVVGMIRDLRKDRPDIDTSATEPLVISPGVNSEGKPFLTVLVDGKPVGQWTPESAREHVLCALEVCAVADLDAGYYRALTGLVGLDEPRAREVIEDLQHHRWTGDE